MHAQSSAIENIGYDRYDKTKSMRDYQGNLVLSSK